MSSPRGCLSGGTWVSITMGVESEGAVIPREKDASVVTGDRMGIESVDA